ncbi:MAG: SulP family inorganic anion transporter, partial [Chloroflexi bacterium]|nr:SulP family inorganic anion transporter [Chloroflexota bacterium]
AALIAATIAPLAVVSDDRVRLAGVLALMVAAVFVVMRLGRMGFLADFLSRPILVGYMTGVGVTVAAGQIEKIAGGSAIADAIAVLAGIDWSGADPRAVADALLSAVRGSGADLTSVVIGASVVVAMLLGRRYLPRIPMALVAMIAAMVASAAFDLQSRGVQVLGPVSPGLPGIGIPTASATELVGLLPGALGLAILSFADTAATGRTFAARRHERTDANRELVALAVADAGGALTGGYAISSSPSRTAGAVNAGSSSQLTGLIAMASVAVVLVLLTRTLSYLPIPALGGVIFVSVLGLIDVRGIVGILNLKSSEGLIAIITMAGVIMYGTLIGVGIAVLLAALNIVRRAAWPQIVEQGRLDDGTWRDLTRQPEARRVPGVIVIRFTGPLFFANATALQGLTRELMASRLDTRAVVLDLAATADIDVTAGGAIRELADDLARDGRQLAVAGPLGPVRDELRAYGLADVMDATGGTRGSIDDAIVGLGLDPSRTVEPGERGSGAESSADTKPELGEPVAEETVAGEAVAEEPVAGEPRPGEGLVVRVLAIALGIVVAATLLGTALNAWRGEATGVSVVPNLVGLSLDRATTAAGNAGFTLAPPVYVQRNDRPENTVVAQDPPAGTEIERGSEIRPVVSTGRGLVRVPDVVGQAESQAIATLTSAGLIVRRSDSVFDPALPAGAVVTTSPEAGVSVAKGTIVDYVVSKGAEPTPTPSATPAPSPTPAATPSPATTGTPTVSPSPPDGTPPVETPTGTPPVATPPIGTPPAPTASPVP